MDSYFAQVIQSDTRSHLNILRWFSRSLFTPPKWNTCIRPTTNSPFVAHPFKGFKRAFQSESRGKVTHSECVCVRACVPSGLHVWAEVKRLSTVRSPRSSNIRTLAALPAALAEGAPATMYLKFIQLWNCNELFFSLSLPPTSSPPCHLGKPRVFFFFYL